MGILEEWFLRIIQLVILFLATSLLYEDYRSLKRTQDLCLVLSFLVIIIKQIIVLFVISGQVFFKLSGLDYWFPIVNNSLETLFYLFMAYTLFLGYSQAQPRIGRTLFVTTVSWAVFIFLMLYYWWPYAYNKIPFSNFWGDPFFEVFHVGLVLVIIRYLYLRTKGPLMVWLQVAFYIILLAHLLHFSGFVKIDNRTVRFLKIEESLLFVGYLTLALSQIRPKIQPKLIIVLIFVLLLPTVLTVFMVSNEVRTKLLAFTYEKVTMQGVLNTVFDLKKALYLIAGLGVLMAGFIGYIFAGRIVNPLAQLVEGAKKVGSGDLSSRIEVRTRDELGKLAYEFNRMTMSLEENTSKLEQANEELKTVNKELIKKGQELVHAAKMASIGQLAGGVAHEINNPLMSMLGWAQMGQELVELVEKDKEASPEQKKYLETLNRYFTTIEEGARRCQVVTESLLKISRQMDLSEPQFVDINQVIEDAFAIMKYQTAFKNINIKKSFSSPLPRVNVNLGQVQQVFFDLISNAVLAMPQGGELSIVTSCRDEKSVEVKITDTGCGIQKENLDKIFNPFFTTRPTGKGMGLGLSVAYGIVKQHSGGIEVQSQEGVGTTFTIRLPVV